MRWTPLFLTLTLLSQNASLLRAQNYAPPAAVKPTAEQTKTIVARSEKLEQLLSTLRRQGIGDPHLADVEIYAKAADWIIRHNEFYDASSADKTIAALERGALRATQLLTGAAPWMLSFGQPVVHAYRSRVDGSLQPYAVTFPENYGRDLNKTWRLDVVLHGRNAKLNEIEFLSQMSGDKPAPKADHVRVDIFGRGNNGYRWAGETDVYEALDHFLSMERFLGRLFLLDPKRVVLRGFSMGGAGTWHLGLHRPDRWCVLGPGAGFTTTQGYVKDLPELTDYQKATLHLYDAVDYAENVFNVPVVAYSGSKDPQMQAALNIEERIKPFKLTMKHLVADGLGHQFPAEWQSKAEAEYAKFVAKGREEYPSRVRFVTWTLRYPACHWVEIVGLEAHYQRALVDAERTEDGFKVKTTNVRALHLALPPGSGRQMQKVQIDDNRLEVQPYLNFAGETHLYFEKQGKEWQARLPHRILFDRLRSKQKVHGLQGPIDDAFTGSFLCVRGTGKPWHKSTEEHAEKNLERFAAEWNRYFRADLPIKNDTDLTAEDIAGYHLILFGDPASNSVIPQVLDALPMTWTRDKITLAGQSGDATNHVPVMIYPNPLNPYRYVVLNSGHTFRGADLQGSNALLYPRLGDYALLKLAPTEKDPLATKVVGAGIFDEFWQIQPR